MAIVVITITDIDGMGGVHGKIRKIKNEHELEISTVAERIGQLMYQALENGNLPGLADYGLEQTPEVIQ